VAVPPKVIVTSGLSAMRARLPAAGGW